MTSKPTMALPHGETFVRSLLVSDLIGSTAMLERLGDQQAAELMKRHDRLARDLLIRYDGREIDKTDGFLLLFRRPVYAVQYALEYHRALVTLEEEMGESILSRIGIHLGEVIIHENPIADVERGAKPVEVEGLAKPIAARLMSLAEGRQTLMSRGAFDLVRRSMTDAESKAKNLEWRSHGRYFLKGLKESIEVFEVGEKGFAPLSAPPDTEKAQRLSTATPASIAILPFTDMSPERNQQYFCDGLAESIISSLSNIQGLSIAARTSTFLSGVKRLDIEEIGSKLKVQTVLEGSLQKVRQQLRITVRLIDVESGRPMWTKRFDRHMIDVFAIQDEISSAIAEQLKVEFLAGGPANRYTDNVAAYENYLKGRFEWYRRTEQSLKRGIEYFDQAVDIDPDYALAYVGVADSYNILGVYYLRPLEAFPRSMMAAKQALDLDDHLAEAHVSKGYAHLYFEWDWAEAEREFLRAIELDANYPFAHMAYCNLTLATGRPEEALALIQRALELDPLLAIASAGLGWVYFYTREYERAVAQFRQTVEMDPSFALGRLWCGWAYQQIGMNDEAMAEIEKAVTLSGRSTMSEGYLAHAHALSGNEAEAGRILGSLRKSAGYRYVPAYLSALVWTGLGQPDRAFEFLEVAYEERAPYLIFLNHDPKFDGLRSDPRFNDLVRRIGLPS